MINEPENNAPALLFAIRNADLNKRFWDTVGFIMLFVVFAAEFKAQQLAFSGAEGYGRFVTGGRGGVVYEVTNLNDSGPGSFREAVTQFGARTIVFKVSGTIHLESKISISAWNLTIAGQTAPGDGICIADYPVYVNANNIIVRYLRFRLGDINKLEDDSFSGNGRQNIILDHCSISWAIDECASWYDNKNFTMQWCIISESLYDSYHSKGKHGYGGIWGGLGATFHHNLLAHHSSRNPRFNGSRYHGYPELEIVDYVNNVIYNWGGNSAYGGEAGNQNIRNNYYKYGPATSDSKKARIVEPSDSESNWYVDGNYVYGFPDVTEDNWNGGVQGSYASYHKANHPVVPFPIAEVTTQSAEEAFKTVLENAGANFPKRDTVDARVVHEVETGIAQYGASYNGGKKGIIDSQNDVGGWPELLSTIPPDDSDHDGMPDAWEQANGLDPANPDDRNNISDNGYTMLEEYLNSLISPVVSIGENENRKILPKSFSLFQNYPNPFNPSTTISYSIPEAGIVTLRIFNITGQLITELENNFKNAGQYQINWNGKNDRGEVMSSGIYLGLLSHNNNYSSIKMSLIR